MTRKEAREQAFILLFEKSFREESMEEILAGAVEDRLLEPDLYLESVAVGVYANLGAIDAAIAGHLQSWTIDRVSRVALAALRLSAYELLYLPEIPTGVSINEAVELTKKYATEQDAAYLNGVLGSLAKANRDA